MSSCYVERGGPRRSEVRRRPRNFRIGVCCGFYRNFLLRNSFLYFYFYLVCRWLLLVGAVQTFLLAVVARPNAGGARPRSRPGAGISRALPGFRSTTIHCPAWLAGPMPSGRGRGGCWQLLLTKNQPMANPTKNGREPTCMSSALIKSNQIKIILSF